MVVVRNMGATDYVYGAISNVSTNAFDITNAVNSGAVSGTEGAYIPAFSITSLSNQALTIEAPSAGNCQLLSIQHYLDAMEDSSITVTVPSNGLENGAGENSSLSTRIPPTLNYYNVGGSSSSRVGAATVSFSTSTNHNIYILSGGLDTFTDCLYLLQF